MEEAAEAVASDDWTGAAGRLGNGRALSKPLVRPRCVVVVHELSEYVVELAASEDEVVIDYHRGAIAA